MSLETKTEPNVKQAVPLFGVRDMEASLRFYVGGLGCSMTESWIDNGRVKWCWLVLGGAAVMLQEFAREGQHRNVPESALGVGVSTNFTCNDTLAIYRELRSRGVEAKRPFVGNAMWVTELVDPDGYKLYFHSPTDVAEETLYSE